jgi:RNA polymerase sigma-70 factor (ECF subfamily)
MGTAGLAVWTEANPVTLPAHFQTIYEQHSTTVYRTALRVTGRPSDAEDVLQTVFLRLWNNLGGINEAGAIEAYLRRSATNAAIDLLRRASTRVEIQLDGGPEHHGPESTVLLKQQVREALAKLPAEDAELFCLRNLDGYSYEELAAQYGVMTGTIASRLHRIRERLLKEFAN